MLALAMGAHAAEPAKPASGTRPQPLTRSHQWTAAELEILDQLEARAFANYPRRRDDPLREINISDSEVREIQVIAGKRKIAELVNIAPVVTGCPCEEGSGCTDQTFLVGKVDGHSVGLQLSRVKNRWDVSRVQKWWFEYGELLAREPAMTRQEFTSARHVKLLEFPQCAASSLKTTSTKK